MKAIMVMYDSLCRRYLSVYGCRNISTPNFERLAARAVTFDNCYVGSMPCMPARREIHTGRHNFMHRSWGPLEPFDDSMPAILDKSGVHTHITSDHKHYWEDGGATYHTRYTTWELARGQEGDPWKGDIKAPDDSGYISRFKPEMKETMKKMGFKDMGAQDLVNRSYMDDEENMPQAVNFRQGLEFIDTNHGEDNWFLTIEAYDPHEPFFASQRFKNMYNDPDYDGREFDWPPYAKVEQTEAEQQRCISNYKALVSMCDDYLGKVLDAMDKYDLWDDTMLIVNTDHGFVLTEHGWWGKNQIPFYNEVAHIPMFIWDPRSGKKGERRSSLVQNIDIAPTVLGYFGISPTKDMSGHDLAETVASNKKVRDYAFFGQHGEMFNVTDGRYVYMRCPMPGTPLYEYTLMPTHMTGFFSAQELDTVELAEPFDFTKGYKTMKMRTRFTSRSSPEKYGDLLFDLSTDPGELTPVRDEEAEVRLTNAIRSCMLRHDAPDELYTRYRIFKDHDMTLEEYREEKENWNRLVFPGLDGYFVDREVYSALSTLKGYAADLFPQVAEGLGKMADALGTKQITKEVLVKAVQQFPVSEGLKKAFLAII